MGYTLNFGSKCIVDLSKDLNFLQKVQERLFKYISDLITNFYVLEQEPHFGCFINLLGKIRINIESINILLPLLKKDVKYKISTNLLYRCIIDDIINLIYLFYFIDVDDKNQTSLKNELDILQKEFLVSIIDGFKNKLVYDRKFEVLNTAENENAEQIIQDLINRNSKLLKDDGKGVLPTKLRETTKKDILNLIDKSTKNNPLSEKTKLKFIEANKFDHHNQLLFLFKYFSQFQHYTPESVTFIQSELDIELYNYANTIDEVIYVVELCVSLLNLEQGVKNKFAEFIEFVEKLKVSNLNP